MLDIWEVAAGEAAVKNGTSELRFGDVCVERSKMLRELMIGSHTGQKTLERLRKMTVHELYQDTRDEATGTRQATASRNPCSRKERALSVCKSSKCI